MKYLLVLGIGLYGGYYYCKNQANIDNQLGL
jgi:hypothetical protein